MSYFLGCLTLACRNWRTLDFATIEELQVSTVFLSVTMLGDQANTCLFTAGKVTRVCRTLSFTWEVKGSQAAVAHLGGIALGTGPPARPAGPSVPVVPVPVRLFTWFFYIRLRVLPSHSYIHVRAEPRTTYTWFAFGAVNTLAQFT